MLTKEILYFVFYLLISAKATDDSNMLTMSSKEVVNTFKSAVTSIYIRDLATDFAEKAAGYFIKEIKNKNKEKQITRMDTNTANRVPTHTDDRNNKYPDLTTLDEKEALDLIKDPSPDGDNLDREFTYLSDIEAEGSSKEGDIPVIGVTKINGFYFRRLLGFL